MFTPSNLLQKYLDARPRDMYDVVGALMGYINADPGFRTNDFEEAIKYVLNYGVSEAELYKDFDSDYDFEEDESRWDDIYYSRARVYLTENFCRKRIEHVKRVAKKVYLSAASDAPVQKPAPKQEKPYPEKGQAPQGRGGQPGSGKKSQGQPSQSGTTQTQTLVKIICLVMIGVALALLLIALIERRG